MLVLGTAIPRAVIGASALSRAAFIAWDRRRGSPDPKIGYLAIVFEYVGLPRYAGRHNMEYVVAAIAAALRTMSGRKLVPAKVAFAHNRNSDVREFERFFGCPVEFGAPNTVFQI